MFVKELGKKAGVPSVYTLTFYVLGDGKYKTSLPLWVGLALPLFDHKIGYHALGSLARYLNHRQNTTNGAGAEATRNKPPRELFDYLDECPKHTISLLCYDSR